MTEVFVVDEEFGPDERYRIYERATIVTPSPLRGQVGGTVEIHERGMHLIATCPSPAAVGIALCQMAEDRWEAEDFTTPVVGVLDGERGRWISGLWLGGGLA